MVRGLVASLSNVSVFSTDVFSCKSQLLLVIYDSCCVYRLAGGGDRGGSREGVSWADAKKTGA